MEYVPGSAKTYVRSRGALLPSVTTLLALSGHIEPSSRCPLLGIKRTLLSKWLMSAPSHDPKRTLRNAQSQEGLDISSGSRSGKLRLRRLSKFLQRRARWREERCAGVRGREVEQPVVSARKTATPAPGPGTRDAPCQSDARSGVCRVRPCQAKGASAPHYSSWRISKECAKGDLR